MIRRELRDSTPIWKLSNYTWDANPSHPMPLVFCTAIHRSSPTYLWRNKSQDSQAPGKKKNMSWRHGSDCEIDIDLARGQDNEAHSETRKCHPWWVPRWATCCLAFLKQDFDPTRIVCFNILKLVLTFYSYSLFAIEI